MCSGRTQGRSGYSERLHVFFRIFRALVSAPDQLKCIRDSLELGTGVFNHFLWEILRFESVRMEFLSKRPVGIFNFIPSRIRSGNSEHLKRFGVLGFGFAYGLSVLVVILRRRSKQNFYNRNHKIILLDKSSKGNSGFVSSNQLARESHHASFSGLIHRQSYQLGMLGTARVTQTPSMNRAEMGVYDIGAMSCI